MTITKLEPVKRIEKVSLDANVPSDSHSSVSTMTASAGTRSGVPVPFFPCHGVQARSTRSTLYHSQSWIICTKISNVNINIINHFMNRSNTTNIYAITKSLKSAIKSNKSAPRNRNATSETGQGRQAMVRLGPLLWSGAWLLHQAG